MRTIILAYHRVLPGHLALDRGTLAVTIERFERQIRSFTDQGWRAITLEQFQTVYAETGQPPRNTFVITFDDGYRDNYTYAFPILKKYKVPATIFLVTEFLDSDRALYFSAAPRTDETQDIDKMLTRQQIDEMLSARIEFGSHTVTHPKLTEISPNLIESELRESKSTLEKYLNREVATFCYPYGDLNENVIKAVKKAGYRAAVVTPPRAHIPFTPFTLRRTGVYLNDSFWKFKLKCSPLFYAVRESPLWDKLKG